MKKRAAVYIDGFNLYFGIIEKSWERFLWLNMESFSKSIIPKKCTFAYSKYFTSLIKGRQSKLRRQRTFLAALKTLNKLDIYYGHYKTKEWKCTNCHHSNITPIEKKTDVNIATHMLADAFEDKFDVAILVTGDSDLTSPIIAIKKLFPKKSIIVGFPPQRDTYELKQIADSSFYIGKNKFKDNQFSDTITLKNGKILNRPSKWV